MQLCIVTGIGPSNVAIECIDRRRLWQRWGCSGAGGIAGTQAAWVPKRDDRTEIDQERYVTLDGWDRITCRPNPSNTDLMWCANQLTLSC